MSWRIGRSLEWIGRALSSPTGQSPSDFDSAAVNPVADVMQGGIGVADWSFFLLARDSTSGTSTVICERDPLLTRLVFGNMVKSGAAATVDARIQLRPPLNNTAALALFRDPAAASTTMLNWKELGGGQQFWIVPPGYELRFFDPVAMTAPDTLDGRFVICSVPAGSKPW